MRSQEMKSALGSDVCAPRFIAVSVMTSRIRNDLSFCEQMNDEDMAEHMTCNITHPEARSAPCVDKPGGQCAP